MSLELQLLQHVTTLSPLVQTGPSVHAAVFQLHHVIQHRHHRPLQRFVKVGVRSRSFRKGAAKRRCQRRFFRYPERRCENVNVSSFPADQQIGKWINLCEALKI